MSRVPHVALLVETSREYGRNLLRGITRYEREHPRWSISFQPNGLGEPPPRLVANVAGYIPPWRVVHTRQNATHPSTPDLSPGYRYPQPNSGRRFGRRSSNHFGKSPSA